MAMRAVRNSEHAEGVLMVTLQRPPPVQQPVTHRRSRSDSYQARANRYSLSDGLLEVPLLLEVIECLSHTSDENGESVPSYGRTDTLPSSHPDPALVNSPCTPRPGPKKRLRYRAKVLLWTILRSVKLPMIYHACSRSFGWQTIDEKTNITILNRKRDGTAWILPNVIHVGALLPTLALILLNASSLYLGGDMPGTVGMDSVKLFGLLFASKIHELLMLASIGSILSTYVRMELGRAGSAGLPVGALFSPFQFHNLSFLFSSEMTGVWVHKWKKARRKILFIGLVFSCCILGVSVGPSSATLMRPRLDIWAAGGTSFWVNARQDELYPRVMADRQSLSHCLVDSGDLACPAGNWQILSEAYLSYWPRLRPMGSMPGYVTVSSPYSGRDFRVKSRGPMIWHAPYTIASAPISPLADSVAELARLWSIAAATAPNLRYKYRREAYFTLQAQQPATFARCNAAVEGDNPGFPIVDSITRFKDQRHTFVGAVVPLNKTQIDDLVNADSQPIIVWLDDPSLMRRLNSSIAAIVRVPGVGTSPPIIHCCSIRAEFRPSIYRAKWSMQKVVTGWPSRIEDEGVFGPHSQAIAIKQSWARYLNPSIHGTNKTALSSLLKSTGLWNSSTPSETTLGSIIIENILAVLVTNGISRDNYDTVIRLDLLKGLQAGQDWRKEMISPHSRLWAHNATKLGRAFHDPADLDRHTRFEFHVTVYGYSYNWTGKAQLLTVSVLALYICLAVAHIGVFVATGRSWAGWNSLTRGGRSDCSLTAGTDPSENYWTRWSKRRSCRRLHDNTSIARVAWCRHSTGI